MAGKTGRAPFAVHAPLVVSLLHASASGRNTSGVLLNAKELFPGGIDAARVNHAWELGPKRLNTNRMESFSCCSVIAVRMPSASS